MTLDSVVQDLRAAYRAREYDRLLTLFEMHAIESWYGLATNELSAMIQETSRHATRQSEMAQIFMKMTSLAAQEHTQAPAEPSLSGGAFSAQGRSWVTMAQMFQLRMLGRPVEAFRLTEQLDSRIAPFLAFDVSGGMRLFITVQNGVTAMLAGRLAEALEFFTTAQLHPLVPSLAFLSRDAYVKAALLHALFGDTRVARTTLDQASSIPRTSSWAEPLIDVAITMTEAVLPGRDADASLEELSALPLQHVGEIWPFYVTALTRTLRESGRIREVEDLLTRYERLPLPRQTGQGYPGSVLPLKRALLRAQALDDSGAELLESVDMHLPTVRMLNCVFLVLRGQHARAKRDMTRLQTTTQPFRQLELWRLSMLANTHYLLEEYEECALVLAQAAGVEGGMRAEDITHFSTELRDFASARGLSGWNASAAAQYPPLAHTLAVKTVELSAREREVLTAVMRAGDRDQAAGELFISKNTLQTHLRRIYRKLGVRSFEAAVLEAQHKNLL